MCWGLEGKAGGKEAGRGREGMPGSRKTAKVRGLACEEGGNWPQRQPGVGWEAGVSVCLQSRSHGVCFRPSGEPNKSRT